MSHGGGMVKHTDEAAQGENLSPHIMESVS